MTISHKAGVAALVAGVMGGTFPAQHAFADDLYQGRLEYFSNTPFYNSSDSPFPSELQSSLRYTVMDRIFVRVSPQRTPYDPALEIRAFLNLGNVEVYLLPQDATNDDLSDHRLTITSREGGDGFGNYNPLFTVNYDLPDEESSREEIGTDEYQLVIFVENSRSGDYQAMLEGYDIISGFTPLNPQGHNSRAVTHTAVHLVRGADGVTQAQGNLSLVSRGANGGFVRGLDGSVTLSSQGGPGLSGGLNTWGQFTGFRSTQDGPGTEVISGRGVQIGADMAMGDRLVAGVSLGYSEVGATNASFRHDGTYVTVQPYLNWRGGDWSGGASVVFGTGSMEQTSIGRGGTADVRLAAVNLRAAYDHALQDGFTFSPTAGLVYGVQQIDGTGGTLTTDEETQFTQTSFGARLSYDSADGGLFAGLHADHLNQDAGTALAADLLSEAGWTGRIELGGSTNLGRGMALDTSVELSGLGGEMRTVSGGLRVALTF